MQTFCDVGFMPEAANSRDRVLPFACQPQPWTKHFAITVSLGSLGCQYPDRVAASNDPCKAAWTNCWPNATASSFSGHP